MDKDPERMDEDMDEDPAVNAPPSPYKDKHNDCHLAVKARALRGAKWGSLDLLRSWLALPQNAQRNLTTNNRISLASYILQHQNKTLQHQRAGMISLQTGSVKRIGAKSVLAGGL